MLLAHSVWRKALVTLIAAVAFVYLYEVTMFDSRLVRGDLADELAAPSPGATLRFMATAYCKGFLTTAGVAVQSGIAASDPELLPVGSVVQLALLEEPYNGIYTVLDTGPAVQGRMIDIYIWSCNEALQFGKRPVDLTVLRLGWNPQATTRGFMGRWFKRPETAQPAPLPSRPLPVLP